MKQYRGGKDALSENRRKTRQPMRGRYLERVDGDKVREKWQHVFNLEQIAALQDFHGVGS